MCSHKLYDGPLTCVRLTAHDEAAAGGHEYQASGCPDAHDVSEAAAEATR